jgi:hypothetical protein
MTIFYLRVHPKYCLSKNTWGKSFFDVPLSVTQGRSLIIRIPHVLCIT